MSRVYTPFNKIKFTSISESYRIKSVYRSALNSVYSSIIMYVKGTFDGTLAYKRKAVKVINILTYAVYTSSTSMLAGWSMTNPFLNMPNIDDDELEESLGDIYLTPEAIEWDIDIVVSASDTLDVSMQSVVTTAVNSENIPLAKPESPVLSGYKLTSLSDVSIKAPDIPQFDVTKVWKQQRCGSDLLTIYTTLPEIPKVQRDVSITTDVNRMSDEDLLRLFPNTILHTRASVMYVPQKDLPYDDLLGVIIPIDGYTLDQCKTNIIQYPHFYKLARYDSGWPDNNGFHSFYSAIEIDGELVDTLDVWNSLDISKKIPTTPEYIKEYVVRKYLMDRDIGHKQFKYPMFGELNPFLTLFMPVMEYQKLGYVPLEIAKACVNSRISFKQSRSPILRRMQENA